MNTANNHDAPDFAAWLRDQLDLKGWTQADFVRASDLAAPVVHRYVHSRGTPDMPNVRVIARTLGLPVLHVAVAAGLLTADEAGHSHVPLRAADLSNAELIRELNHRLENPDR